MEENHKIQWFHARPNLKKYDGYCAVVVVPAYNEEETIGLLIDSIKNQQTNVPVAVIVVDNNSKDKTKEVAEYLGAYVITEVRQGVGFARQAGLDVALSVRDIDPQKTLIIQTDADCVLDPNYVEASVVAFKSNPSTMIGTGPSIYNMEGPDGETVSITNGRDYKELLGTMGISDIFKLLNINPTQYLLSPPYKYLIGPNTVYRSSFFRENSWLRYESDGRWETLDLSIRIQNKWSSKEIIQHVEGQRVLVSPRSILNHHPKLTRTRLNEIRSLGYVEMYHKQGVKMTPIESVARTLNDLSPIENIQ